MASARSQRLASLQMAGLISGNLQNLTGQLEGYNDKAIGAIDTGYGKAESNTNKYLSQTLATLGAAHATGRGDIRAGAQQGIGSIRQGIAGLDPYAQRGNQAGAMYANSLGLNGAGGNQAAVDAFQAGPGYQWQVDQATDAAARKANALGISASGNTLDAITRLGSNLANQEYGSWQDRLSGLNTTGQAAATAQLGGYQNIGQMQQQQGQNLAQLMQNFGQNRASALNDAGKTLATLGYSQGRDTAGLYSGLGNTVAGANMASMNMINSNAMGAAAASDAARNANGNLALGLGGQILGLGIGGGQTIGGSIFSGLGSLFK